MTDTTNAAAVRQLAPTGKLRAAINFGNPVLAQNGPGHRRAKAACRSTSRTSSAGRLAVPVEFVTFDAAGKVFEALRTGAWDVAFLAIDPKRATEIEFTSPYVIIEGSYMVPADSPLRSIEDVDRPGVRIAVGDGSAYELYLSRTIAHAQIVRAPTGSEALAMFFRDRLEAVAGVKSPLRQVRAGSPGPARDGRAVHGDRAGDGHAERRATKARATCAR